MYVGRVGQLLDLFYAKPVFACKKALSFMDMSDLIKSKLYVSPEVVYIIYKKNRYVDNASNGLMANYNYCIIKHLLYVSRC